MEPESPGVGEDPSSLPAHATLRTFLIADVRGYTGFTIEQGDEAAAHLATRFAAIAKEIAAARGGEVIELRGDEALAVFSSARQALRAATDLQERFIQETLANPALPFRVGIGLDAGEAIPVEGGYRGAALNLAARLCSLAGPGEVLISDTVANLARKIEGLEYSDRGSVELKGFTEPVRVCAVLVGRQPAEASTLRHMAPFAEQVRRYRRERGLTQEELAEKAGLSARGIRALEHGERSKPHKDTVRLLAEALDLSPEQRNVLEQAAAVAGGEPSRAEPPAPGQALPIGGFLGSLPAGKLVARQQELARVLEVVAAVSQGAGRLVLLAGEPGAGKTRLAQEATIALHHQGFLIGAGRCYAPQQTVPYYPFLDVLAALHASAPASLRREAGTRWPYLGQLLPDEIGISPASFPGGGNDQQRLFRAVTSYVAALAEHTPVAVLLDDLHWADRASLDLLGHLVRHTRDKPILILGTYRDVEVRRRHPLEAALHGFQREGLLERIEVRRFDAEGTTALMAATFGQDEISEAFASLVHRHTDGNPFFTQEVLQTLVERGDVFQRGGTWDRKELNDIAVPESVRSAIDERVSRLNADAQQILVEASVLGQSFDFDDLAMMGEHGEAAVESALEEAVEAGLVREMGQDRYGFNHALTHQALYAELPTRRRRRLHRAAGHAIERLPGRRRLERAGELAWHFLQADEPEQALSYSVLAGDEAEAVFAHADAEQHYRTALDLARERGDRHREVEILQKLGAVLRVLARYAEALEVLDRAAKLYLEAGDYEGEARTMRELGIVHYYRGTPDQGIVRVQAVTERLGDSAAAPVSPRATGELFTALMICLWPLARYSEALVAIERAVQLARAANAARTLSLAESLHGKTLTMLGVLPEARRVLEEAISLFDVGGDPWEPGQPQGDMGRAYVDEGDLPRGLRWLKQARALIEAVHEPAEIVWIVGCLGELSYLKGDWSEARQAYDEAVQLGRESSSDRYLSYVLLHRAELLSTEGEWEPASLDIEEGVELATRCAAVPTLRKAERLLAERDLGEGRSQSAIDRLQPLLDQSIGEWPRAFPPPVLAEAYLSLGDVARAEGLVVQRVQRFRTQNHRRALAVWLRMQGMVLRHQRRWDEADRVFAEAVALAQAMPYPYAEGRILYEYGLSHLQRGDPEQAGERLGDALAIFCRLGARKDVERTQQVLVALDRSAGEER